MANIPTSSVIAAANPGQEGPGSGVEAGGSDSVLGICTDIPNPKPTDWPRTVIPATSNPIGQPVSLQYLVDYKDQSFDKYPVGFASADQVAAPYEVYATDTSPYNWDLANRTVDYTTKLGDWLWGVAETPLIICKTYECDALTTMIQTKNPQSLYDLTQGWAAISTPGSGTGSVTPTSGDLVYDIVGGLHTKMSVGGGNVITPEAAGIFDSCGNTSINSNTLTTKVFPADGLPPWVDGGTLVFVQKDNTGATGGALGPVYETFTGANPYSSRAIFNGGISEVIVDTAQVDAPGVTVSYATTSGARFAAFTWEHSGNSTTVKVYEETGKVYEETVVGTVGGSRDLSHMGLNWYLCSNAVAATWATPLSESDMADIVDAWNQNQSDYVDPRPECQ